jgi:VanZ family protein
VIERPGRPAGADATPTVRATIGSWLPAIAYVGLIFSLSSIRGSDLPAPFAIPHLDKVAHLLEYSLLGLLLERAIRFTLGGRRRAAAVGWTLLAGGAVGALDEIYQRGIPGRSSDIRDWIVDVTAVGLSLALAHWARARPRRRRTADSMQEGTE